MEGTLSEAEKLIVSQENSQVEPTVNTLRKEMEIPFKKPSFIGKARGLKKALPIQKLAPNKPFGSDKQSEESTQNESENQSLNNPEITDKNPQPPPPVPYKEPTWSGLPSKESKPYTFEVLKNGVIIENINLMDRPYWVFGRLPNCDIPMQHPTISRYHAVLQYRAEETKIEEPGFYIYDLSSTHGTFLNNKSNKLKTRVYTRIHVGQMIRLGCSQRSFILTGPDQDQEDESEFTVTELKQQKADRIQQAKEEYEKRKLEEERRKKKEEEKGVDWGMGDDASDDEEENLSENPYAQTNNEELYLDDPKKALRGFFEREGYELDYDCTEQGMGQFLCKVELPLDDDMGRPIVAEVLHKGKKKEAVIQCALEACRILDRYGVLRNAVHESKKRKSKNWEENDYYDSDDDTFLDRTGAIEQKREKRMRVKQPKKAETYESLLEKEKSITASIADLERQIQIAKDKANKNAEQNDEDSLDSFMKNLNEPQIDKQKLSKIKLELVHIKKEHANIIRLINLAKPANLPIFTPEPNQPVKPKITFPIVGKRPKSKLQLPKKPEIDSFATSSYTEGEEVEEDSDTENNEKDKDTDTKDNIKNSKCETKMGSCHTIQKNTSLEDVTMTNVDNKVEKPHSSSEKDIDHHFEVTEENLKASPKYNQFEELKSEKSSFPVESLVETLKRSTKSSNKKRKKEGDEKIKGYDGEKLGDDYSMWVPPSDQSGDGRTSLNEKLGY